mmetsp:Transcript_23837/g.37144  ORF Transcript_23837/g.37144 Transcript_23837/m.37144 type:complete len:205 (-) Transcript_23837:44-658(-)
MPSPFIVFIDSIDPSLGRIDKHSLSQHTLMELLIEKINTKERIRREDSPEVNTWWGVDFADCAVKKIDFSDADISGSIQLEWLPLTVKIAYFSDNYLTGTVCLTKLPDSLSKLSLACNSLTGTIDVTKLPDGLNTLIISHNQFEGETDFSLLPGSLECFWMEENTNLSGSIIEAPGQMFQTWGTKVRVVFVRPLGGHNFMKKEE